MQGSIHPAAAAVGHCISQVEDADYDDDEEGSVRIIRQLWDKHVVTYGTLWRSLVPSTTATTTTTTTSPRVEDDRGSNNRNNNDDDNNNVEMYKQQPAVDSFLTAIESKTATCFHVDHRRRRGNEKDCECCCGEDEAHQVLTADDPDDDDDHQVDVRHPSEDDDNENVDFDDDDDESFVVDLSQLHLDHDDDNNNNLPSDEQNCYLQDEEEDEAMIPMTTPRFEPTERRYLDDDDDSNNDKEFDEEEEEKATSPASTDPDAPGYTVGLNGDSPLRLEPTVDHWNDEDDDGDDEQNDIDNDNENDDPSDSDLWSGKEEEEDDDDEVDLSQLHLGHDDDNNNNNNLPPDEQNRHLQDEEDEAMIPMTTPCVEPTERRYLDEDDSNNDEEFDEEEEAEATSPSSTEPDARGYSVCLNGDSPFRLEPTVDHWNDDGDEQDDDDDEQNDIDKDNERDDPSDSELWSGKEEEDDDDDDEVSSGGSTIVNFDISQGLQFFETAASDNHRANASDFEDEDEDSIRQPEKNQLPPLIIKKATSDGNSSTSPADPLVEIIDLVDSSNDSSMDLEERYVPVSRRNQKPSRATSVSHKESTYDSTRDDDDEDDIDVVEDDTEEGKDEVELLSSDDDEEEFDCLVSSDKGTYSFIIDSPAKAQLDGTSLQKNGASLQNDDDDDSSEEVEFFDCYTGEASGSQFEAKDPTFVDRGASRMYRHFDRDSEFIINSESGSEASSGKENEDWNTNVHHHANKSKKEYHSVSQRAFRRDREALTIRTFQEFNTKVFEGKLSSVSLKWSSRLRTTAGITRSIHCPNKKGENARNSAIELSTKCLTDETRLRSTLLHEMCHAAAWTIDGVSKPPHGKCFQKWANHAMKKVSHHLMDGTGAAM